MYCVIVVVLTYSFYNLVIRLTRVKKRGRRSSVVVTKSDFSPRVSFAVLIKIFKRASSTANIYSSIRMSMTGTGAANYFLI